MTWGQDEAGITAMVAAQMERQKILYEPGRLFRIVILEAALSTRLVSPAATAGQLDRLLAVTLGAYRPWISGSFQQVGQYRSSHYPDS